MTFKVHFHLLLLCRKDEQAQKLWEIENKGRTKWEQPQSWTSINIYWAGVSTVFAATENTLFIPWAFSCSLLAGLPYSQGHAAAAAESPRLDPYTLDRSAAAFPKGKFKCAAYQLCLQESRAADEQD